MKSNPVAYLFLIGLALTFLGHGAMRVMLRDGQPVDPAPMDQLLEEMPEERDTTSGATWDLPVTLNRSVERWIEFLAGPNRERTARSEEHTSELQSRENLVCRLRLEKKNQ